ncbi:MAG: AAA family ATPase, partial [Pseudomonadota bacterium]
MIPRLLKLPEAQSYFLFGPRNTGKSTLLNSYYNKDNCIMFNLLDPNLENRFARDPVELVRIVKALPENTRYIVIDEIQKVPKLLDIVHQLIETTDKYYVMSGSSARKLKYGGANLLAGRAFVYNLFPFSFIELGEQFDLDNALAWGTLPKIKALKTNEDKKRFLDSYSHTYLREEIWAEHFIKDLDPFRKFLEVAAQMNGMIINFHKIAQDVGVDDKTIKRYYAILEDTLIGFFLDGFQNSFRKRLSIKPKFYFFDSGVARSLARMLTIPVLPRTSIYGEAFEHFIILECIKLSSYYNKDYRFSYLRTKDDAEIDLIIERPGKPILFIEIKSTDNVTRESISSFIKLSKEFGRCEAICLSKDPYPKNIDNVTVLPWKEGLIKL